MKEYLNANYELIIVSNEQPVCVDWIEVPDGAEMLVYFCGDSKRFFYKGDDEIFKCNQWIKNIGGWSVSNIKSGYAGEILWQRSESEKQAEACENKHFSQCIPVPESAWDKQTGGEHYKKLAIQPMEYALKNKLDYAQANVVKYVTRHADKNGKEDLLKAIHNIELMIEYYYPE